MLSYLFYLDNLLLILFVGGWWAVTEFRNIKGNVAIEMGPKTFLFSMDNGLFTLGAPHKTGKCEW